MRIEVDWTMSEDTLDFIKSVEDKVEEDDWSIPLTIIAKDMLSDVQQNFATNGRGQWAPISEYTKERWPGRIGPLRNPAAAWGTPLYEGMHYRVRPWGAMVFSPNPLAHLHDNTGRKPGFTVGKRKGRKPTVKQLAGRTAKDYEAKGQKIYTYPGMPSRPFMYIREEVADRGETTILDWLFSEGFLSSEAA